MVEKKYTLSLNCNNSLINKKKFVMKVIIVFLLVQNFTHV